MSNTSELVKVLKQELSTQTSILRKELDAIKDNIRCEGVSTRQCIGQIEGRISKVELDILASKRNIIKNNIIVTGLPVEAGELVETTISQLNSLLNINLTIDNINDLYKLGKKSNSPIKIEFVSYIVKKKVIENRSKLRGKEIFINDDLCPEDRAKQKVLREHLREAKRKNFNAYIKNQLLFINGERFTYEDLKVQSDEIDIDQQGEGSAGELNTTIRGTNRNPSSAPDTPNSVTRTEKLNRELEELCKTDIILSRERQDKNSKVAGEGDSTDSDLGVNRKTFLRSHSSGTSSQKTKIAKDNKGGM